MIMERRTFITLFAGTPALVLLAACGSDDVAAPTALPSVPNSSPPPNDAESRADFSLEFGYYGGFTTREVAFQMQPSVLVTSTGDVITPGATTAIYPGPLLPVDIVRSITPAGVDRIIDAARQAGMFADVAYETNPHIADAGTATLRIELDGMTYEHEAYALGAGGPPGDSAEESPERQAFADFAELLSDLPALVGSENLGPERPYEPESYQLIAFPVDDPTSDIEPTFVDWPESTGITLAELTECTEVPREAVGDLFASATQLTYFVESGVAYSVVPRPSYPGRSCPD